MSASRCTDTAYPPVSWAVSWAFGLSDVLCRHRLRLRTVFGNYTQALFLLSEQGQLIFPFFPPPASRVMFRIITQMAGGTHGHEILRPAVRGLMIQMRHGERVLMRVEFLPQTPTLLTALFTLPVGFFPDRQRDGIPVFRICFPIHRHLFHLPFGEKPSERPCTGDTQTQTPRSHWISPLACHIFGIVFLSLSPPESAAFSHVFLGKNLGVLLRDQGNHLLNALSLFSQDCDVSVQLCLIIRCSVLFCCGFFPWQPASLRTSLFLSDLPEPGLVSLFSPLLFFATFSASHPG